MKKTLKLFSLMLSICLVISTVSFAGEMQPGGSGEGQMQMPMDGGQGGDSGGGQPGGGGGQPGGGDSAVEEAEPVIEGTDISTLVDADGNLALSDPSADYIMLENVTVNNLEIAEGVSIQALYPVILFYEDSTAVENGQVIGNVQFVNDYDEVAAIIHTNDVHGNIEVEPYVKGLADEMRASGDYSLVVTVSAGDIYAGGEAVAQSYNGEFIPAIMNNIYDIAVPGNNDYTLNAAVKQNILLNSLYTHTIILCANYTVNENGIDMPSYAQGYGDAWIGNELFDSLYEKISLTDSGAVDWSALDLQVYAEGDDPYINTAVFTTDKGTEIGFFGLSTHGGAADVSLTATSSIETSQACVDELHASGASVIVGIGHTGWPDGDDTLSSVSTNDTNSAQIALNTSGIDAFVDGHTHSVINKGEGWMGGQSNTLINQAECFGSEIGIMYLYLKDGICIAKDGINLAQEDYINDVTPNPEVQDLVTMALEKTEADLGAPIASTPVFLNGERGSAGNEGGSVRANETNLGDLMTDIIFNALNEQGVDVQFVIHPGYWLRSSIEAGDISKKSIQSVYANPTVLDYVTYTAADIVAAMEKCVQKVPEDDTTFTQVSGITMTYTMAGGKAKLVSVSVGDTQIYDNGSYLVDDSWTASGINLLTGGEIDNWEGSTDSWIVTDKTQVQDLVINYIINHKAGVDYTIFDNVIAPDGRITCID